MKEKQFSAGPKEHKDKERSVVGTHEYEEKRRSDIRVNVHRKKIWYEMRADLETEARRVLNYWEQVSWDSERRMFLTLGCDNRPLKSGYRSAVLIARILWAYSSAYRLTGSEDLAEKAADTWHFIKQNICVGDGSWNWLVTREGRLISTDDPSDPLMCPYHSIRVVTHGVTILKDMMKSQ